MQISNQAPTLELLNHPAGRVEREKEKMKGQAELRERRKE